MVGLRERKKVQTRDALEAAAMQLFGERGFDRVTIDDIAAAAGVSARTFFRYFRSKDELVLRPFLELHLVLQERLGAEPADVPVTTVLRRAVEAIAEQLERQRPVLRPRVELLFATPALGGRVHSVRETWRRMLVEEAARRMDADPAVDLRPHASAAWAMAGLAAAREVWDRGLTGRTLPSLLAESYELLPLPTREPGIQV